MIFPSIASFLVPDIEMSFLPHGALAWYYITLFSWPHFDPLNNVQQGQQSPGRPQCVMLSRQYYDFASASNIVILAKSLCTLLLDAYMLQTSHPLN